jgi:hypothetical protein
MSNQLHLEKREQYLLDRFYEMLVKEKPNFISTKTNYHRRLLYLTLEKYGKEQGKIWCQRKKENVVWNINFCRKHRIPLETIYHNLFQDNLFYCSECLQTIDQEDTELYITPEEHQCQTRQVVGLNIFYKYPNIKKIKYFSS